MANKAGAEAGPSVGAPGRDGKRGGPGGQRVKETSKYRCVLELDVGRTRGSDAKQHVFCLYFAKGCCSQGSACTYLHRLPTAEDEAYAVRDLSADIFGREKRAESEGYRSGAGTLDRDNRTLYINYEGAGAYELPKLRQLLDANFSMFGPVNNIYIVHNKTIAFVRYDWRSSAEFAKEAMHKQSLVGSTLGEVVTARWANEDPNPVAVLAQKRACEEAFGLAVMSSFDALPPDQKHARVMELQLQSALQRGTSIGAYPSTDAQFEERERQQRELKLLRQQQEDTAAAGGGNGGDDDTPYVSTDIYEEQQRLIVQRKEAGGLSGSEGAPRAKEAADAAMASAHRAVPEPWDYNDAMVTASGGAAGDFHGAAAASAAAEGAGAGAVGEAPEWERAWCDPELREQMRNNPELRERMRRARNEEVYWSAYRAHYSAYANSYGHHTEQEQSGQQEQEFVAQQQYQEQGTGYSWQGYDYYHGWYGYQQGVAGAAVRHYGGVPMDVDQQLLQLIQTLRGRPAAMEVRAGQPRQADGAGDGGAAAAGQPQQQPAEAPVGGGRRYMQMGMLAPGMMLFGGTPPAAQAAAAPAPPPAAPPPSAIPEPDAQAASQLGEMGFGEAVVRKALLLHRNEMEAALNWLLQHGEDPAAAEPLTEEQLRQIYSRGPRGPPSEPELVEQLVAMGFDRNQSTAALRRFRNMDMALAYLLRAADEGGDQQQPGAAAEGGVGAAAVASAQQSAGPETGGVSLGDDQGAQPAVAATAVMATEEGSGETIQTRGGQVGGVRGSEGGESVDIPEMAMSEGDDNNVDMLLSGRSGRNIAEAGEAQRADEGAAERGQAGGSGQHRGGDTMAYAQDMAVDGADDEQRGDAEEDDDMDEDDDDDDDGDDDGDNHRHHDDDDDDDEDDDDDDDFTGGSLATVLQMPLRGAGGLGPDDPMAAMAAFEGPFTLYGGAPHGVGATTPAMAVTRGPDGHDLVLGSTGTTMPPLMPARGMMLGGITLGVGGAGGGMGLAPPPMDLPGLLQVGGPGDDELEMRGMGLVQQLLNAVLRDAMGGGEGPGGAALNRR
ncbi:hypothetical protein VOLCADRAFT_116593 [Volvox carteri f. nagariensis]|uniref:Uncharacterized protein n=1 Tax=Volvox carteri f. nagariensis TaxID=3068 RepID=D8TNP4_VOLCA|nr:uncharacterized protein VOLCADRAFT_116593 [Volvox carteri f. nagariensis]EFJ51028.1 hypothetical protein VOLCADRAFT_116593 [Volvox carteri f. nagariensis]|eukprot:XP_002948040.1 hypothetical protein VOLCADRAFT_116593 [Volvox carteri f. nagariensis]